MVLQRTGSAWDRGSADGRLQHSDVAVGHRHIGAGAGASRDTCSTRGGMLMLTAL